MRHEHQGAGSPVKTISPRATWRFAYLLGWLVLALVMRLYGFFGRSVESVLHDLMSVRGDGDPGILLGLDLNQKSFSSGGRLRRSYGSCGL